MSKFKKGDTVYSGRGTKLRKMVVARVIDNPMIPIYQYSFEEPYSGFACGEQSIRENEYGEDLKISECFKDESDPLNDEVATRLNTTAIMKRQSIDTEGSGLGVEFSGGLFFKPNLEFCEWLRDYAGDRIIIDVGCGQGHLVRMLKMTGARAMGLEPNFNFSKVLEYASSRGQIPDVNEVLSMTVQEAEGLINGMKGKALLIFARPCHSDFVEVGIYNMPKEMEALYITVPGNIDRYDDLGGFKKQAVLLDHKGVSEDSEIVYSIKKK